MEAYYGLPSEVKFCKKCVMSNQRPGSTIEFKHGKEEKKDTIVFDENGVCSACKYHETKTDIIDWNKREEELEELLSKYRRNDGSYDVIVPGSGGKDSSYTAYVLKYKYNMNPLTVTWSPGLYTDIGRKNLTNWSHIGGANNLLYTPDGQMHRLLTREAFKNLLHPFQTFILGQKKIGPEFAMKFGINLVIYGENPAEYGNNIKDNNQSKMKREFFSIDDPKEMIIGGKKVKDLMEEHDLPLSRFTPYIPPHIDELDKHDIDVHYLGYFHKWDPQECFYHAVENSGFETNPERTTGSYSKYSSIDDKIDFLYYYTRLIKFGFGRTTHDAAQEIRNEKITREEGVNLVKKYDQEFPEEYLEDYLEYLDMDEDEFWETIDKFRSPHIWKKIDGKWFLRHTVSQDGCDD